MTSVVVLHNNIHWVVGSFFHGQTPDSENGYALLVAEMTKFNQQGIEEIIRRLFKNDVLPSIKIVNRYPNMGSN